MKAPPFEKTTDLRAQQKLASHSLPDLFEPLSHLFNPELKTVIDYFSQDTHNEELRLFSAKAFLASESLLTFSKNRSEEFALTKAVPSTSLVLEMPEEVFQLISLLETIRSRLSKMRQFTIFVQRSDTEEDFSLKQRQYFLFTCLERIEKGMSRLQDAFKEVKEETPLAFSAEVLHASALFLENSLLTLISYFSIQGDDGGHKIFQKVSTHTQTRSFKYVHHLKILSDILRAHFADLGSSEPLFDTEMDEVIITLQLYNPKTHRYLAHDESPLGRAFKKLHDDTRWRTGVSVEFRDFRESHTHPILIKAINTTIKLLNALPVK